MAGGGPSATTRSPGRDGSDAAARWGDGTAGRAEERGLSRAAPLFVFPLVERAAEPAAVFGAELKRNKKGQEKGTCDEAAPRRQQRLQCRCSRPGGKSQQGSAVQSQMRRAELASNRGEPADASGRHQLSGQDWTGLLNAHPKRKSLYSTPYFAKTR